MKLDKEEKSLLASVEAGEWVSVPDFKKRKKMMEVVARNTLKKDIRMNIRMSKHDLLSIKQYAAREGLPYQSLVTSVLHKFVSGQLVAKR